MSQSVVLAIAIFLVQVPLVVAFTANRVQIHPIVFILPLIGFLNNKVEGRSKEGLGLRMVGIWRSLLLAVFFAFASVICWLLIFQLEGINIQIPPLEVDLISSLAGSFLVSVFVLALFEEMTCRGYMQTRLQEAWGFRGVVLTVLLFAALHLPSALFDYASSLASISFRFLSSGIVGFGFGVIFWHTKSIVATATVHGLNNFANGALTILTGIHAQDLLLQQPLVALFWLAGQVTLTIAISKLIFGRRQALVKNMKRHTSSRSFDPKRGCAC